MGLLRVPDSVKVSALTYEIHFDRAELAQAQKDCKTDVMGATNHLALKITVDPLLPYDQQGVALLHEVEHTIFSVVGIRERDKLSEEELIQRTSTILLQVLRDNPVLVDFLLGRSPAAKASDA